MKRININDIALKAGVSKATVSHVINNTRFVEDDTRQRVVKIIEETGFEPSSIARSLTTKSTQTIGVLVSDITNSFFGEILRGIEDILHPMNYSIVVCNTDEILEREDHYINILLRQRVDGIIAAATSDRWESLEKARRQHIPVVLLDRYYEGADFPFVGVNNFEGAYLGTRHLIDAGYREIGILSGFQRLTTMQERLAGFKHALNEYHIDLPDEWIVSSPLSMEAGREAAHKIFSLPHRPRALFLNNNFLSLGTLFAINDLKLRCPEDIAIVGFDDHSWAAVACSPLTVVSQPIRNLGQEAAKLLMDAINGKEVENRRVELECNLIIRDSCCPTHSG